jgi:transposase
VPLGILVVLTGALTLIFGSHETSDFWVDCLRLWWEQVRELYPRLVRLVIYLDNGPKNSGTRTQFLKRLIEFADESGLEIRLVYYPLYHSKYNPIERCWSSLQKKWNGVLLTGWEVVKSCALRMRWRKRSHGTSPDARISYGSSRSGLRDENSQPAAGTFRDSPEIRHHHQAKGKQSAGKLIPAGRLITGHTAPFKACPSR